MDTCSVEMNAYYIDGANWALSARVCQVDLRAICILPKNPIPWTGLVSCAFHWNIPLLQCRREMENGITPQDDITIRDLINRGYFTQTHVTITQKLPVSGEAQIRKFCNQVYAAHFPPFAAARAPDTPAFYNIRDHATRAVMGVLCHEARLKVPPFDATVYSDMYDHLQTTSRQLSALQEAGLVDDPRHDFYDLSYSSSATMGLYFDLYNMGHTENSHMLILGYKTSFNNGEPTNTNSLVIVIHGSPGTGKTTVQLALAELLPPWQVLQVSHMSDHAISVEENFMSGKIFFMDEIASWLGGEGYKGQATDPMTKKMQSTLTTKRFQYFSCHLQPGGARSLATNKKTVNLQIVGTTNASPDKKTALHNRALNIFCGPHTDKLRERESVQYMTAQHKEENVTQLATTTYYYQYLMSEQYQYGMGHIADVNACVANADIITMLTQMIKSSTVTNPLEDIGYMHIGTSMNRHPEKLQAVAMSNMYFAIHTALARGIANIYPGDLEYDTLDAERRGVCRTHKYDLTDAEFDAWYTDTMAGVSFVATPARKYQYFQLMKFLRVEDVYQAMDAVVGEVGMDSQDHVFLRIIKDYHLSLDAQGNQLRVFEADADDSSYATQAVYLHLAKQFNGRMDHRKAARNLKSAPFGDSFKWLPVVNRMLELDLADHLAAMLRNQENGSLGIQRSLLSVVISDHERKYLDVLIETVALLKAHPSPEALGVEVTRFDVHISDPQLVARMRARSDADVWDEDSYLVGPPAYFHFPKLIWPTARELRVTYLCLLESRVFSPKLIRETDTRITINLEALGICTRSEFPDRRLPMLPVDKLVACLIEDPIIGAQPSVHDVFPHMLYPGCRDDLYIQDYINPWTPEDAAKLGYDHNELAPQHREVGRPFVIRNPYAHVVGIGRGPPTDAPQSNFFFKPGVTHVSLVYRDTLTKQVRFGLMHNLDDMIYNQRARKLGLDPEYLPARWIPSLTTSWFTKQMIQSKRRMVVYASVSTMTRRVEETPYKPSTPACSEGSREGYLVDRMYSSDISNEDSMSSFKDLRLHVAYAPPDYVDDDSYQE